MIRRILLGTLAVLAGSAVVASAAPKEEVQDAAKKLSDAKSYSWKQNSENLAQAGGQGGRGFGGGPQEGKAEKDGVTHLTMTFGENRTDILIKGDKGAVKTDDGWKSFAELAQGGNDGGQPGPQRFIARMAQNFKGPATQAEDLVKNVKDLQKDEGAYKGELTEEGAKQLMSFGGRGRRPAADGNAPPQGPQVTNPKANVRFWVENGVLTKYEYTVTGTMSFNGTDIEINRKTTVEIKDVGSTKVEVPDDAKAKLS